MCPYQRCHFGYQWKLLEDFSTSADKHYLRRYFPRAITLLPNESLSRRTTKRHDERTISVNARKSEHARESLEGRRTLGKTVECLPLTCTDVIDELRQLDWDQPRGFQYKKGPRDDVSKTGARSLPGLFHLSELRLFWPTTECIRTSIGKQIISMRTI